MMTPIPYSVLVEAVELLTVAVVSSSAAKGVWDAIKGLRAKYAAKRELLNSANSDLVELSKIAKTRPLTDDEVRTASGLVLQSLSGLEEEYYSRIEGALRQGNRSGERRYIQELITTR